VKDVVHLDDGVLAILEDRDAVVRRPEAAALHAIDDGERRDEEDEVEGGDEPAGFDDEGQCGDGGDAEPDERRQLQPRDERETAHAGQAAEQVEDVCAKRRPSGQLAPHALRDGDEERRYRGEEQRQEQRAFDGGDRVGRPAGKINGRRARQRDFEAQAIDRDDDAKQDRGKAGKQVAPPRGEQAAEANPEKAGEEDEVREIRQQPDICRHPTNQRGF